MLSDARSVRRRSWRRTVWRRPTRSHSTRRNIPTGRVSGSGSAPAHSIRPSRAAAEQEPPLTPEYQAIWEQNLAEEAGGGQTTTRRPRCLPGGMPRMMIVYEPMEIIITPETTYIAIELHGASSAASTPTAATGRKTSSRPSPAIRSATGSMTDGDGRYDTLAGRDPRHERSAHIRGQRHSAAQGQSDRRQGAHLSRQDQSGHPASTRSRPSTTP